jgi:RNA polymerase sigma factor (sigma-70 family)
MDFKELIEKTKKGEKIAIEELIGRFRHLISKSCKNERNLNKRQDLENIMTMSIVEATRHYTGPDYLTFPGYLSTWLINIAHNYSRKEAGLKEREESIFENRPVEEYYEAIGLQTEDTEIPKLLKIITREEKQLILLHLIYDFTWQEIGALFQENRATMFSRYKKAVEKLQREGK